MRPVYDGSCFLVARICAHSVSLNYTLLTSISDQHGTGSSGNSDAMHRQRSFSVVAYSDAMWRERSGSRLAQVMVCCLTASSHFLNSFWLIASEVLLQSPESNFTRITSAIHWKYLLEKWLFKNLIRLAQGPMSWNIIRFEIKVWISLMIPWDCIIISPNQSIPQCFFWYWHCHMMVRYWTTRWSYLMLDSL